jgi:2-octaprenylphenol hydroxylase
MIASRYDVVIAGAGLPGLALARGLARERLRVAIVDRAPIEAPAIDHATWDARVYAVSPGSVAFLVSIDAWPSPSRGRIEAIESMRVEGDRGAVMTFSAYDLGERALAWIVEERELRASLVRGLGDSGIDVLAPARFAALSFAPEVATLSLDDGRTLEAKLVVGADGVRSWVRESAGIVVQPRDYGQTAVVANFACERRHRGFARQWFRSDGGVLAWLPLPGDRISIVWSAPRAQAQALMLEDAATLATRVADAGTNALGALDLITPPATFPLSYLRLPAMVAHRMALVGDAAHGIHPLAGQGVNLGFGDAHALRDVIAGRGPVADVGAAILLERYATRRAEPVLAVQTVTDGLARLFAVRSPLVGRLRNLGLAALERMPIAKQWLAQPALR